MENASKALIIAGAILLAILLISLGIMIFNQAQDTVSGSGMSQAEITAFNAKFTKYEGDQKGSVVKSLIQEVKASNATDDAEGNGRHIYLNYKEDGKDKITESDTGTSFVTTGTLKSTATYTVTVTENDNSGYISKITIEKK